MTSLDPQEWNEFRRTAHQTLDEIITMLENIRDRDVWKQLPKESQKVFERSMPLEPRPLDEVVSDVMSHVAPYGTGNTHPRFMGWVHGAGTPVGMIAEMISAGLNLNCGGRNHVGLVVERQIASWLTELIKYPPSATGLFVTGSSIANFMAIYIALVAALGRDFRRQGHRNSTKKMVAYSSAHSHGCISRGLEMVGLGSELLRRVPVDTTGRISLHLLEEAIARDRSEGLSPFLVVGTAGTVETGAVDQLGELAAIAAREKMWFHVDGAIGTLALLSDKLRPLFRGIEQSHSIALDFHKWGHVPYDAGFLMVRNSAASLAAFSNSQAYLQRGERGLASGDVWPCDLGPDLSRGFRALKTWMTFEALGAEAIAKCIDENCSLAAYMARRIEADPLLELKAPVALNIVCFGVRTTGDASALNREIVMSLQDQGIAAPSWTKLGEETVIRCAIVNHRTTRDDVDVVLAAVSRYARQCSAPQEAHP